MNEIGDEASLLYPGYLTPPLSPTKTVSTEGWLSPRTPGSPRKSRSCFFFRDINNAVRDLNLPPETSPRKCKYNSSLEALSVPVLNATDRDSPPVQPYDDSPVKRQQPSATDPSSPYLSPSFVFSHTHSRPATSVDSINDEEPLHSSKTHIASLVQSSLSPKPRSCSDYLTSETLLDQIIRIPLQSGKQRTIRGSPDLLGPDYTDPSVGKSVSQNKLHRLSSRNSSSPIRCQSVARERLLTSPRYTQTGTPDRFIGCRRPPTVARESFELNSPAARRKREQAVSKGTHTNTDAFSRRIRRSDRMNEELRELREAYSLMSGRTNANRRNVNFRRGSVPLAARQVSSGAVWNVGGPSAVSDTVIAVSTGRGRMISSGTNAPLYRSAFLNRADPEAELEAYAQRVALALDIDQTDRILQHSSLATCRASPKTGSDSQVKHVWRDSAWVRDGLNPRLSLPSSRHILVNLELTIE